MQTSLTRRIMDAPKRWPLLIGANAGIELIGANVKELVTNANIQAEAVAALHDRFNSPFLLTAMDLSVEAEAFGCEIHLSEDEIPTVIGRKVTGLDEINHMPIPKPGDKRTSVYLNVVEALVKQTHAGFVMGGMIGPFSLAGRLFGVSDILEATLTHPEPVQKLIGKCEQFLTAYALAFRDGGAAGVVMAEPVAGLLSPSGLAKFSAPYIKRIVETTQDEKFTIIYHNCGARLVHLPRILEIGAEIYHFGEPMDLPGALARGEDKVILCGNLDPTSVFYSGSEQEVVEKTRDLLTNCSQYRGFIPSSGCDLPPGVPLRNLEAFYATVGES